MKLSLQFREKAKRNKTKNLKRWAKIIFKEIKETVNQGRLKVGIDIVYSLAIEYLTVYEEEVLTRFFTWKGFKVKYIRKEDIFYIRW